jgi:hypothetical protein
MAEPELLTAINKYKFISDAAIKQFLEINRKEIKVRKG